MADWTDRIENIKYSITTGDGKIFYPLWRDSAKNTDYNSTGFNFIRVPGTLVERKERQGSVYPLVFYFDGADNVEKAKEFEASAEDKRPWTIVHPIYDTIKGQPTTIGRTDSLNFTEITIDFWESIDVDYPNANFSVKDNTLAKKQNVLDSAAECYSDKPVFVPEDIVKAKDTTVKVSSSFDNVISENPLFADALYTEYQYATAIAMKASDNLLNNSFDYIVATQALMNLPARVETSVSVRLTGYKQVYGKIKGILLTIGDKLGFQSNGAAAISNYADAAVNPIEGDYTTMPEVQIAASELLAMYEDYVLTLDNASVSIYEVNETFQPDAQLQLQLYDIVMYTIGNLYETAFEAQQERVVYTDRETNLILLTHRYLGLDASDENIERFRVINNIRLNELFKIKKDRKIKYYV